jgi:RNA polymerase sigma factor (sigma-70 family)
MRPMNAVLQQLRKIALRNVGAGLSDGLLLGLFVEQRDEAAFEALVRRHGAMVWGVCRRMLLNCHDAEDAFQATFLVLVRKARSVVPREIVGNWLYGVAYNTAAKARAVANKRRTRERQVPVMPDPEAVTQDLWLDLQPILDQELSRLPDPYRIPVILCDLEGKTRKEAARQLGWPEGTLSSRLSKARVLLAKRLARHGLTVSGGALAVALAQGSASAGYSAALVISTLKASSLLAAGQAAAGVISSQAAVLMEGVLKTMLLTRLKIATAVLAAVSLLAASAGLGLHWTLAAEPPAAKETPKETPKDAPKPEKAAKPDKELILGMWEGIGAEKDGEKDQVRNWIITADKIYQFFGEERKGEADFKLEPTKTPKAMDLTWTEGSDKGQTVPGIYTMDGDTLTICLVAQDSKSKERPTGFATKPKSGLVLLTFKRLPKSTWAIDFPRSPDGKPVWFRLDLIPILEAPPGQVVPIEELERYLNLHRSPRLSIQDLIKDRKDRIERAAKKLKESKDDKSLHEALKELEEATTDLQALLRFSSNPTDKTP